MRKYSRAWASISIGELFDNVGARQRINGVGHAAFRGQNLLRAQGQQRGSFRGQGQRFIASVGVQRLRPAQHRRQRLQRDAHDVHVGLLRGERGAGGLRVEAEHPGARVLRLEALPHDARPQPPRGAELGDFFQQIVVRIQEEREARREFIHRPGPAPAPPPRRQWRWPG